MKAAESGEVGQEKSRETPKAEEDADVEGHSVKRNICTVEKALVWPKVHASNSNSNPPHLRVALARLWGRSRLDMRQPCKREATTRPRDPTSLKTAKTSKGGRGREEGGGRRVNRAAIDGPADKLLRKDNFLCFGDTRPMHDQCQPTHSKFVHSTQAGHSAGRKLRSEFKDESIEGPARERRICLHRAWKK